MESIVTNLYKRIAVIALILAGVCGALPPRAAADQIPSGWEASNMKPIGYSDLGGHEAFKMAIKHVGDKWYLYMGHFVAGGWSIVDVTDPTNPEQVAWWKTGATGTHRDGYPGGKYANLSAGMPGFKGQIALFLDVSDPLHPKEAGR